MKKIISLLLCAVLIAGALSLVSCSKKDSTKTSETDEKIRIVTTIFPIYDWVQSLCPDNKNIEISMLADSGADLHSFQPTADDIISIKNSDLFIFVGGESDEWAEDASENSKTKAINLLEVLGDRAKEEELAEGMQGEEEEEEDEDAEEETEYDEHIWLSLRNAEILVEKIGNELCELDKKDSQTIKSKTQVYISFLKKLDEEYENTVENAKNKTLLFGDRFPFRYLTDDYSIDYYAAFVGCSAETEASFET
ncbi:MAG: zinc ABC transporter substrate-binding protein, partial [Eubacterium sp.]|nr:zinc ABC transporter substrate-binding protein [Eubacterium sp.]